jgi:tetratricopeptide (TPR) repeat protein
MTQEEEERLRSLGYLGGASSEDVLKGSLPDPKDKMGEFQILYKARVYEWDGKLEEAEKYYREMVRLEPNVSWNYVNLAVLLYKRNKLSEAIEILKGGLVRMPDNFILLSRLSLFYMRARNFKEAYDVCQATLKQDPRYFDALVYSGWALEMLGKWEESSQYYKKALEIEPENRYIQMKYAYALATLGRSKEALEIYDQLKKETPNDYRIYSDIGIIYSSLGNLDLARENLKKAVELSPSPETYLNYAAILEKVGKLSEAITYIKLYLDKTPEGETPRKTIARKALAEWERRVKGR